MKTLLRSRMLAALLAVVIVQATRGGTVAWNGYGVAGGTGSTSWNTPGNWSGGVLPGNNDTASFSFTNNTSGVTITLDAPQTVGQLSVATFANAPTWNIGNGSDVALGNTLSLWSVFRGDSVGNMQTVAANVILSSNSVWDIHQGYNNGLTVSGSISGSGKGLTKWGANGTLYLQGTNTYTGGTAVNAGILQLNFNTATAPLTNIVSSSSPLSLGVVGTLAIAGKNAANARNCQVVNGLTLNPGASSLTIADGIASGATLLSLGGVTRNAGSTVNFSQPTVNATIGPANGYATSAGNDASGILGAYASVGGADWAANNGTNIVAYAAYATLTGNNPTISGSTTSNVRVSNASTGAVSLASAGTTTINTLLVNDTVTARTNLIGSGKTLRFGAVGGVLVPSTSKGVTIDAAGNAGTLTAGGVDNTPGEVVINNSAVVTNNAVIANNGSGAVILTKSGSGTLVLNAACTHTGGTFMNAGSLLLPGGINPLSANGALTMAGGTLNLGGGMQTNTTAVNVLGGTITNGTIVSLNSDYGVQAGTLAVGLRGPVGFLKNTPGVLTLSGSNSYSGTTTLAEGSVTVGAGSSGTISVPGNLVVGAPNDLLAASVASSGGTPFNQSAVFTVYANGSLNFGSGAQYLSGSLTLIGGFFTGAQPYFQSGSAVYMTGGSFNGSIYGNGGFGITSYSNATPAVVSASLVQNSHTFTVNSGAGPVDLTFTGSMNGNNTLTKAGSGVMVMNNSYHTNGTLLTAGTLFINGSHARAGVTISGDANAVLGGVGTVGGAALCANANITLSNGTSTNSMATLAPGGLNTTNGSHVLGTLTVGSATQTNSVTFGKYTRLLVRLGAGPGSNDCLVVNGKINLGSASNTNYVDVGVTCDTMDSGDYTIATFNVLTGRFFGVRSAPGTTLPQGCRVNYLGTPTGNGNELVNGSITFTVPGGGVGVFCR